MSQRELAKAEGKMYGLWSMLGGKENGKRIYKRDWLCKTLGGKVSHYQSRSILLNTGGWGEVLFRLVDEGTVTLRKAISLRKKILALSRKEKISTAKALELVVSQCLRGETGPEEVVEAPEETKKDAKEEKKGDADARLFKAQVMENAEGFVERICEGYAINGSVKDEVVRRFKVGLGFCISDLINGIREGKRRADMEEALAITVADARWACEVLGIRFVFKKPPDERFVVRKANKRAAELHPDRNPTEAAKEEFDRVNKARVVLLAYLKVRRLEDRSLAARQQWKEKGADYASEG